MKKLITYLTTLVLLINLLGLSAYAEDGYDPFNGDKDVNIVFLGGSLTFANGWRVTVGDYLTEKYTSVCPGRTINTYNAGVGGTTSLYGIMRLEQDVISHNPDMVFIDFAANDMHETSINNRRAMEGIVRRLQRLDNPPIIVFVYTHSATLVTSKADHIVVGDYYKIPQIDFSESFKQLGYKENGIDAGINYYYEADLVHTNVYGHKVWSDYMIGLFESNPQKYFAHPRLAAKPLDDKNYENAKPAFSTAREVFSTSTGVSVSGDSIIISPGSSATFDFEGSAISVLGNRSSNGALIHSYVDDKLVAIADSQYEGPMDIVVFSMASLSDTKHTLKLTVQEDQPNPFEIKGVYTNNGSVSPYPIKYADESKINTYTEPEQKEDLVNTQTEYIDFLTNMGLDSGLGDIEPTTKLSRGQMACIMANLAGYGNISDSAWISQVFGNAVASESQTPDKPMLDVEPDYIYADQIRYCKTIGLINGGGDGYFEPISYATTIQVVKLLEDLCGYRLLLTGADAFPNKYINIATDIKLLEGTSLGFDDELTYQDFARLIYNALCSQVISIKDIKEEGVNTSYKLVLSDNTLSEKLFDLKEYQGQFTQNEFTSLVEENTSSRIVIAGEEYSLHPSIAYANAYIGRDVKGLVGISDGVVRCMFLTNKDEVVSLTQNNIPSYSNYTLTYYQDRNASRSKSVRISKGCFVIYNGIAVGEYSASLFNIESGFISVIKPRNSSEYSIVVIDSYINYYVTDVDYDNSIIYYKLHNDADKNEADRLLKLKDVDVEFIKNETNANIDFASIMPGGILSVAQNGTKAKIYYSNSTVNDFVLSQYDTDDCSVSDGNATYYYIGAYTKHSEFPAFNINNVYTLYLNAFGDVVWIGNVSTSAFLVGMLVSATYDKDEDCAYVRLSNSEGIGVTLDVNDKSIYKDNVGQKHILKNVSNFVTSVGSYKGIIRYKVNGDNKLTYLEIPLTDPTVQSEDGQLYDFNKIYGVEDETYFQYSPDYTSFKKNYEYSFVSAKLRSFFNYDNLFMFFKDPVSANETAYFAGTSVISMLRQWGKYIVKLYGDDINSGYATYCVNYGGGPLSRLNDAILVAKKVYTATYGVDNDLVKIVEAYKFNAGVMTEVKLVSRVGDTYDSTGKAVTLFDHCMDLTSDLYKTEKNYYQIEPGDIFVATNKLGDDDFVSDVIMVYKAFDTSHERGYVEGTNPGWLAGTDIGHIYKSTAADVISNPFMISDWGTASGAKNLNVNYRVLGGYVVNYDNGVLEYTTQDLSTGTLDRWNPAYVHGHTCVASARNAFISYKNGKISNAKFLTEDDIKSYYSDGNECSKMIILCDCATVYCTIILNYER